eukprot:Awhi_evm1s14649
MYSNARTFVRTNGYLSSSFNPSRDVRQGDPLSPFFVEWLDEFGRKYSGMKVNFDKTILMYRGEWLDEFGRKYSGMKVNFDKTILMYRGGDTPMIKTLKQFVDYTKGNVRYLVVFVGDEKDAQEKNEKNFAKESYLQL